MRKRLVVNLLSLLSESFYNVIYLYRISVKNGVGYQTQTTGLVHNFFVVACVKGSLIRKENPAW